MSVPRESEKEYYLTIENDTKDVYITPSILDGVIVVGKAPEQHQDTMLWAGHDNQADVLYIKTADGRMFKISNAEAL